MSLRSLISKVSDELTKFIFNVASQHCLSSKVCRSVPDKKLYVVYSTDWTEQQEDPKNADLWERDWDDDSLDDELSKTLREQLSKPAQPKS